MADFNHFDYECIWLRNIAKQSQVTAAFNVSTEVEQSLETLAVNHGLNCTPFFPLI